MPGVFRKLVALVFLGLSLGACDAVDASSEHPPPLGPPRHDERRVFVVSNGWHSALVLARADLPADRIPEIADFPRARFLEFGWGDAEFYQDPDPGLGVTLRAGLVPTPAVLHVSARQRPPLHREDQEEVVPLNIDAEALMRLAGHIAKSYDRRQTPRALPLGPGLSPRSLFYPATGRFHLGNTCNTWTAAALEAAGFDVTPAETSRAEDLMRQVRRLSAD